MVVYKPQFITGTVLGEKLQSPSCSAFASTGNCDTSMRLVGAAVL